MRSIEDPSRQNAPDSATISRRSGFVTAAGGARIYFEACGSGPALVLVHGLGGNHAVWFHQVAHFASSHLVVTLSQRGFAPSTGNQDRYSVDTVVADLEAVMDEAGIAEATVVGQSMGGWTALGLALRAPGRVTRLVLADTAGGISDEKIHGHMRAIGAAAAAAGAAPLPLGVHPALSQGFSRRNLALACLYQSLSTFGSPPVATITPQLAAARVEPASLRALRMPTLFLVGSEDQLFPPDLLRHASVLVPGARVTEIPDAGHSPYIENPGAWNRALEEFLAERG
ncbi:MAG TPA: alpha/beta hydrolase [Candidatus Binatia bacterium]|jgi:pimeloyl-ACP methyl ester carboxylesterase